MNLNLLEPDQFLIPILEFFTVLAELGAGVVIAFGIIDSFIQVIRNIFTRNRQIIAASTRDIRLQLGRWLALGIEFELAADIIQTAIAPTWDEIGKLAAIIILRTILNYFLDREIRNGEKESGPLQH